MSEGIADYAANVEPRKPGLFSVLWNELKPFPGRDLAALRMGLVCTALVLLSNTFRLPLQDVIPFLALFTAKEEKITTTITAVLALVAITLSVGAALLIFKCTGNRPEFRIPAMAAEIFVGMYLFRILSMGPVGFILAFIVSVSQSIVDLFPTPEEAVHEFLWVWVAVSLAAGCGWLATLILFPVPASRVLQREFISGWRTVSTAANQLREGSPVAGRRLLQPLAKLGPLRLLKLLKLSLLETHGLRPKQKELTRLILTLDKTSKLIFSYSGRRLTGPSAAASSSSEKAMLGRVAENAEYLEREFADGFVPSGQNEREQSPVAAGNGNERQRAEDSAPLELIEAEQTLADLATLSADDHETKPSPSPKKSLFVADAFTNPRHAQFALKVTLAGMIGYIFYTASDYFGIHTVYYTPLIIALGSTGATLHKGVLRIAGCLIGGGLGLICTIWLIPRFETLGMYLLIVFCLHGLAAWVAFGSERISYMGLQIALTFDLGVLKEYGPPTEIDPIRDRFIGIILGILIISAVFSLVWPEEARSTARQKLAACLRAFARLLSVRGGSESNPERERLELEVASRLAEANASQEQAAFEEVINRPATVNGLDLEKATVAVEEIYVASLPWIRKQSVLLSAADQQTTPPTRGRSEVRPYRSDVIAGNPPAMVKPLVDAVETSAAIIEGSSSPIVDHGTLPLGDSVSERLSADDAGRDSQSLEQLVAAVKELQGVVSASKNFGPA
jgi:multidrug resistance protein MdtO